MSASRRTILLYLVMTAFVVLIGIWQGGANLTLLLVQITGFSLIALGLNVQFGYGGLFNFAIMGFLMVGGASTVFISFPINHAFWNSDGPMLLGRALVAFIAGAGMVWLARQSHQFGFKGVWKTALIVLAWAAAYIIYRTQLDPAAKYIESTSGWVGGLGLSPVLGWLVGGAVVGIVATIIGKITLGLRTDYLAIATIGISEILKNFVKNMDWLTRGTLSVSPVPWPVPLPQELQAGGMSIDASFVVARLGFIAVTLTILVIVFFLIERAYRGPWGRMMRAIRDNYIAASSMGKNITARQLEIFVLGSILMGIGGSILVSFGQILDPSGYIPVNHTFLIWVMVIVGGVGNNWGTLLGVVLIYIIWIVSDPIAQIIFLNLSHWSQNIGWGAIPEIDSRASQMRVLVLGVVITIALRYFPRGLLPETVRRER
jgi:branched-chain amino acid transport system permease protein